VFIESTVSVVIATFLVASEAPAIPLDLSQAVVMHHPDASTLEIQSAKVLVEEVAKRTGLRWPILRPSAEEVSRPAIYIGSRGRSLKSTASAEKLPREGFAISTGNNAAPAAVVIVGADERGVLFGVGKLLRLLDYAPGRVLLSAPLELATSPAASLRGHQLGYRPKTNSYDAWDVPQWEQYIRDLAVFGANAIELIPPRSDDDDQSPHFPRPKMEMMVEMSAIADRYGMDVWVWYPAMDGDYSQPRNVDKALNEWREVLKQLPRVDAVFVPSGDPGDARPRDLMALLQKQVESLRSVHPRLQMWVSVQSFTEPEFDEMMAIIAKEPDWLAGVVFGPQTRVTLPELRSILPKRYPIRRYPDITHSLRCEYPVPDWDRALAFTLARECINPRPIDQATVFRAHASTSIDFITYSEGCNDDVNKAVWSGLGWDPQANVRDILREYARYFIDSTRGNAFAEGLLALERNGRGPLLGHSEVLSTLQLFQSLERSASPAMLLNPRFQQALYRAYYDAYIYRRLLYETALEEEAMDYLRSARPAGVLAALNRAEEILDRADAAPVARDLRQRVFELAEALFQSWRMQLSVERYRAIDVGRGANLDTIDVPLNNRVWLKDRFADIRSLDDNNARLRAIRDIVHWTDPGPGGFYDDLGDPLRQPHLVRDKPYETDPGFLRTPTVAFNYVRSWRLSWMTHVDGLYKTPVVLRYDNLDPTARYKERIVYAGDNQRAHVQLLANDKRVIHPLIPKPAPIAPVEFTIPHEATRDGELRLEWSASPERGGPGRGCQIAEVWLLPSTEADAR
jgi:hypothetical protein